MVNTVELETLIIRKTLRVPAVTGPTGDVTEAENGATEFIDVPLAAAAARYVVPQVNIYSGEWFDEVAESMFGYMTRARAQRGMPFEARTVRTRSDMRGTGRVALPVVFARGDDRVWTAKWLTCCAPRLAPTVSSSPGWTCPSRSPTSASSDPTTCPRAPR